MGTTTTSGCASYAHRSWEHVVSQMYRDHFSQLCRAAQRYVDSDHAAEEVVQEAFCRFATMQQRPRPGHELSYLRSIVINEAKQTLRRGVIVRRSLERSPLLPCVDTTVEGVARIDAAARVQRQRSQPSAR